MPADSSHQQLRAVVHAEDDDLRLGRDRAHAGHGLRGVVAGDLDVEEDHVGVLPLDQGHRSLGVARFADDLEVLLGLQDLA